MGGGGGEGEGGGLKRGPEEGPCFVLNNLAYHICRFL